MGLLMDIRRGKRLQSCGHALIAWLIIGAGLGWLLTLVLPDIPYVGGVIGMVVGMAIGCYAEWGASPAAKVLTIPGMVLEFIR